MGFVLGMNGKTYYQTDGVSGSAGWVELSNIKDLTLNLEKGEADITTRANGGWRANAATLKDGTVEFQMLWDDADAGFTAIKNAYFNDTHIGLTVLDGPIGTSGSQGLRADFVVQNMSRDENLEEAMMVNVTLKPTYIDTAAAWYVDAG